MTINTELAGRVLDRIIANPKEWDQDTFCGTRCCFAGHTLLELGYHASPNGYDFIDTDGSPVYSTSFRAAKHLGLDSGQVDAIFYYFPMEELSDNDIECTDGAGLRLMINRVAEVTGIDPEPYLAKVADLL